MCGIAGLYSFDSDRTHHDLTAIMRGMTDAIAHRGPDSDGVWQDPDHPQIVLGHRRLAIIDLSPLGYQPMVSHSGRYWCVYNGEIYNYQAIEAELRALGHHFKGRSDTEVFLTALDQWGLNQTCQKIIGMYAFIIWDRDQKTIHVMRDRLGKKPLYIGWAGKNLVMGSELKAVRAHPDFHATINHQALNGYMTHGFVQAPATIHEQVWTLPPGARMTLPVKDIAVGEDLTRRIEYYWDLPRVIDLAASHRSHKSDAEYIQEFDTLLRQCVKERMISDVPLGAFLSGGIDSSVVTALMQTQSGAPVKTYTIGFDNPDHNEAPYARDIARHIGTDHHEMILTDADALAVVPQLAHMYDEPFADISQIPTYLVAKFARQDVTVALSGDGGDEMLGGYTRHTMVPKLWARAKFIPLGLRRMLADGVEKYSPEVKLRKLAGVLRQPDPTAMYEYLLSAHPDGYRLLQHGQKPIAAYAHRAPLGDLTLSETMMFRDTLSYLPDDVMVKVDRAAMAISLEGRAPLLDKRVAEYVWSLPSDCKIRDGQGKWLLRQVLARYVPAAMFNRPKRGFTPPVDAWLRGALKDWAGDLLNADSMTRDGYLKPLPVHDLWDKHQRGVINAGTQLWTILMFQAWLTKLR